MRSPLLFFLFALLLGLFLACNSSEKNVLVFSKTEGFRHGSIEDGIKAMQKLGVENNMAVEVTEDASLFNESHLKKFDAIIFLNTTGDVLNHQQQADFERYIQAGGGFVGIHAATDTEEHWPWYKKLVGAHFDGHPAIQEAQMNVINKSHPSTLNFATDWTKTDEWYNFRNIYEEIDVLVEMDKTSYEGSKHKGQHPMSWFHEFDGGRAFYTGMGHTSETFSDSLFLKHVLGGINYAIGNSQLDYSKATTMQVPDESRFNNQVLDFNLNEPMELDEIPGLGIIYVERRGAVKLLNFEDDKVKQIAEIDVFYGNEDGLIGIAVDPDFENNQWIYLCYSDPGEVSKQNVSRYKMIGDSIDIKSEIVVLSIPTMRKCCHSGGSLEFGKDGLLYIGLGDNTNPFESQGFAPIDERPNRQLWDAQRSASNTNDLRGKILRIKPEADGTYSIPKDNLFAEGQDKTRPEIYVMGTRNPFRFSIDSKTNYVYWGDVGPDSGKKDSLRGPAGMGEFNQAREAGYFGWPYTRGNNQVYNDYDFKTEQSGEKFDPNNIINDSPNNTGLNKLPPINPSMVWYSYASSEEFPWLGKGGVNPMAGPIYHKEDFGSEAALFPDYFENKLFVYEWMRDWIYLISFDANNNFQKAEPFMPSKKYSHPMDMLFGSDGHLYILEYGQKWNSRNMDARLNRVQYIDGNRPPIAKMSSDLQVGAMPLTVQFSSDESIDYDKDELNYKWDFGGLGTSAEQNPLFTFEEEGVFDVILNVTDSDGNVSESNQIIMVGNAPPEISIDLDTENLSFWEDKTIGYSVSVSDKEDGSTNQKDGKAIDPKNVKVTLDFIPEGEDLILATIGHQQNAIPEGLQLINDSDCKACHAVDKRVSGPSYVEIAEKYESSDVNNLVKTIIKGSQGVWGDALMSAHPQLEIEDVEKMIKYILSLDADEDEIQASLALNGKLKFNSHSDKDVAGKYVFMVSYLDNGNPNLENSRLADSKQVIFKAPLLEAESAEERSEGLGIWQNNGATLVGSIADDTFMKFEDVSFNGLKSIKLKANYNGGYDYKGAVEIRKGAKDGKKLGEADLGYYHPKKSSTDIQTINLSAEKGLTDLYLVFKNEEDEDQYILNADWVFLNYNN